MEFIHTIRNWCVNLFRPRALHKDLDEEMEHHLSMTIDKKIAEGMNPELAKKAALKEFGAVERLRDECLDAWGTRLILDTVSDIRIACRQLIKSKGYMVVTLLTIALCSGLNVSIYRYVHAWIVKPFDYPNAEEVVAIGKIWKKQRNKVGSISPLSFVEIEREARSFKAIGLVDSDDNVDVVLPNGSTFVTDVMLVTPGIWDVAGVRPLLGNTFTPESMEEGHEKVVVIGYPIWQSRFSGSLDVIGKQIRLDDRDHTIVGVMPDRFNIIYPNRTMWLPREIRSHEMKEANRESNGYRVIARLNEGVGISQAQVELDQIFGRTFDSHPESQAAWERSGLGYGTLSLKEFVTHNENELIVPGMTVLQAVVLSVFAIGCLNVAGLTLVRGMSRVREISMRASLGASRWRVMRQLLTETLLLFGLGGLFSIPVIQVATTWLQGSLLQDLPFQKADFNISIVFFAAAILFGFGLLFGWIPARSILRSGLSHSLASSDGRTVGGGRGKLLQWLMVGQIALSCCLLILAVTLVRNGFAVMKKDYGFVTENRTLVKVGLPSYLYPDTSSRRSFFAEARDRFAQLPGVHNVGYTNRIPLTAYNMWFTDFEIVGKPLGPADSPRRTTMFRVSPEFFPAMGIELVSGRLFEETDHAESQPVVIIDEQNAKDYFGDRDPIGSTILFWKKECRVVGVVAKTINMPFYVNAPLDRALYFPHKQWSPMRPASFVVHGSLDKGTLMRSIQKMVRDINPKLLQIDITTIDEVIADSAIGELTFAKMSSLFAALAYGLTLIGIYGVISYTVKQKTKEIGIRIAIGGSVRSILVHFMKSVSWYTLIGILLGLIPTYFLLRFLSSYLNAADALHLGTFLGVTISIFLCALLASFLPILRAATVVPTEALRVE